MGKIIIVQFRRSRLPRRRLHDGRPLEPPPVRAGVIAFLKRKAAAPKPRARHLTLVVSGK
jgi:hypothetical protein